jgi:hypothetical protein
MLLLLMLLSRLDGYCGVESSGERVGGEEGEERVEGSRLLLERVLGDD